MIPFCSERRTNARSQGCSLSKFFSPQSKSTLTPTTKLKKNGTKKLPRRTVHKLVQVLPLEPRDVDEVDASQRELAARVAEVRRPVGEDEIVLHFFGWNLRERELFFLPIFCGHRL